MRSPEKSSQTLKQKEIQELCYQQVNMMGKSEVRVTRKILQRDKQQEIKTTRTIWWPQSCMAEVLSERGSGQLIQVALESSLGR